VGCASSWFDYDVVVDGDAGWLERMLLNLLGNALKFTNEGGRVVPRVSRQAELSDMARDDARAGRQA
jgi:signal transduction histidine kinase